MFSEFPKEVIKIKIFFHFDMREKKRRVFFFFFWGGGGGVGEGNELYVVFYFEMETK
jgi:hypothetical protein